MIDTENKRSNFFRFNEYIQASGSRSEGEAVSSSSLEGGKRPGVSKYKIFIILCTVIYKNHRHGHGTKIKTDSSMAVESYCMNFRYPL